MSRYYTSIKFSLALLLGSVAMQSQAQQGRNQITTPVFRANVFNPGLSYEFPAGKKQTILVEGGFATNFGIGFSSSQGTRTFINFYPVIDLQYRYYYNFRRRTDKGKRTALNSMNYLAPVYSVLFTANSIQENTLSEEPKARPVSTVGAVWGIQRNFHSRFSLDLALGAGYIFAKSSFYEPYDRIILRTSGKPTAIINLQLGIWLNKRS